MNANAVPIAQHDPIPNLTGRMGNTVLAAQAAIRGLTVLLRELDQLRDQLAEHGVTIDVDLGPVGNAAMAARRDLEKRDDKPRFSFPASR